MGSNRQHSSMESLASADMTPLVDNQGLSSSSTRRAPPRMSEGSLTVTVLSLYDLTIRNPPTAITITVNNKTVRTGPPSQRHKDRNSFKFNEDPIHTVSLEAPLPELYNATAVIRVVYGEKQTSSQTLQTEYPLHRLAIHETKWLVLHLEPLAERVGGSATPSRSTGVDHEGASPTVRLQMTLAGPYRTEIAMLVQICQAWFRLVDSLQGQLVQASRHIPAVPSVSPVIQHPWFWPTLLTALVAGSPIWISLGFVGLPVWVPLGVFLAILGAVMMSAGIFLYSSSRNGREAVGGWVGAPIIHTILSTPSGQRVVYQTGDRPSPVQVLRALLPHSIWSKLIVSLAIDAVGNASYLIPVAGEGADLVWAPLQTLLLVAMYDTTSPSLKYLSFAEELLPFTDIIPSATLGWTMEFVLPAVLPSEATSSETSSTST